MKKFRLIALAIVCILSTACFFACDKGGDSSTSTPEASVEQPAHVCQFGEWEVITEASCSAAGSQQRVCVEEGCDAGVDGAPAVETEAIAKLPHTFGDPVVVDSTCAVAGTSTRTCSVCGEEAVETLALLEHTWGEWHHDETTGVTTCAFAAKDIHICDVCGASEHQFQELLDHNLVNGVCSVCGYDPSKSYTYKTYTSVSPSNWNELTYQDNNDTQIMSYIGSPLFESDFKFAADGSIVPGEFVVEYSFATGIRDLTAQYVGQYGIKKGDSSLVWEITIRDDGKWQNGDPIVAEDFVYTMQEQLNPLFLNYRADSFYNGATVIHGARNYAFQGQTVTESSLTKHSDWAVAKNDSSLYFDIASGKSYIGSWIASNYSSYKAYGWLWVWAQLSGVDCTPLQGKTWAEISADPELNAIWEASLSEWKTEPNEELHFFCHDYTYPEYSWNKENVGMWSEGNNKIILVLNKGIELLDAEGNLTYHAFYEFASLPLVHKATYEDCKVAPKTEGGLWTSTYNSSVETTMSWGPYKLTNFQAGKYYVLEKNLNWYGYGMEQYAGQYKTTRIECETITSYETAFLKFLNGDLTGIGIDVTKAPTYKNSEKAYYTPDDFVGSMQLQSDKNALASRESEGVNKTLLSYKDFRKAISLSFDRLSYTQTCTTASLPGFGIFNSMHYYDVANGKVYRNTDTAKEVLCRAYGVDIDKFFDLDEAYAAITGYDMAQAKELLDKAYAEALEAGDIKETDKVVLTYGSSADNESVRRNYNFIKASLENLAVGTSLEGRLTCDFDASFGSKWADDFRAGAYDICQGGWSGAAWDPGYFLLAYLSPDYMYSAAWDTSNHMVTITVPGVKVVEDAEKGTFEYVITNNAADSFTATMPAYGNKANEGYNTNWYQLLNNEFRQGVLVDDFRLAMIGALEEVILGEYYSVPISYSFGASLISYQVDYITYEYNTFNGYGGIQYMTYHYSDAEWAEYLKNNTLDYTK